jgi:RNA polymerase sigma-70 factor (ECF subfamily)
MDAGTLRFLLESAKSGDQEAFEEIMMAFNNFVFSIAYHATGSRDIACDVTQETWVRVWKALPEFQTRGSFPRWLETIARNVATDCLRRRSSQAELARESVVDDPEAMSPGRDRMKRANRAEETVRKLLDALPPHFRTAVVLFELEGRSVCEVAKLMGESEGTVRIWLHRARAKMRRILEQMEIHDEDEDLPD